MNYHDHVLSLPPIDQQRKTSKEMAGCKVRIIKPTAQRLIELSLRKYKKADEIMSTYVQYKGLKYSASK